MKSLTLHQKGCAQSSLENIYFDYQNKDQLLSFNFKVMHNDSFKWNINHDFKVKDFKNNWGLWNYDVFEVFLLLTNKNENNLDFLQRPYLEFQISPMDQFFAVKVIKARQIYQSILNIDISSKINLGKYESNINLILNYEQLLALEDLSIENCKPYFNAYTILGKESNRSYYGLNLDQNKLDFHLPYLFMPMENICE